MISRGERRQLGVILTVALAAGLLGTFTADVLKAWGVLAWQGILLSMVFLLVVFYFDLNQRIGNFIGRIIG